MRVLVICVLLTVVKVGGEYAPHHVNLLIRDGISAEFPGSGVIVSLNHILTVAINIDGFVEWEMTHGNEIFGRETLLSKKAIVHPDYSFKTLHHNLGIITLPKTLKISPATLPVKLPDPKSKSPHLGDYGLVASYHAMISRENKMTLTYGPHQVVEQRHCREIYPKIEDMPNYFCANQNQYRVCGGSQGSAYLENIHTKRTLVGILSIGEIWDECTSSNYLVYLQVSRYVNWIRRNSM